MLSRIHTLFAILGPHSFQLRFCLFARDLDMKWPYNFNYRGGAKRGNCSNLPQKKSYNNIGDKNNKFPSPLLLYYTYDTLIPPPKKKKKKYFFRGINNRLYWIKLMIQWGRENISILKRNECLFLFGKTCKCLNKNEYKTC